MSKERLEDIEQCIKHDLVHNDGMMISLSYSEVRYLVQRVQELEKGFELCDSTMHMIDMTINNPSTSDDDKWEKVKKTIKKYYEDDCIHCNGKGFNGLDYCPNCTRGAVIQENSQLEQQNKRYREAVEELIGSWKDNVKSTKQHNESDYSIYREGLIEALQFAIDDLELALEELE